MTGTATIAEKLRDLAKRVDRNVPTHSNPEAFHEEKSEIARDLNGMARQLGEARQ